MSIWVEETLWENTEDMKVRIVFNIMNNPVWMCKLKDEAKYTLCLIIEVMTGKEEKWKHS